MQKSPWSWPDDQPFTVMSSGLSSKALRHRLERGLIRRVCAGAYVNASVPDTLETRTAALTLVVPAGSVVCRSTAAWVHGVDAHVTRFERPRARRGPGRTRRCRGYSPPRGPRLCRADAQRGRRTGERGWVRQLRELVELADGRSESPRESWLRLLIIDSGFPPPLPQYVIQRGPGLVPYRLDLAWPDLKVAVEYDGAQAHGPDQAARDAARRQFLRQLGWTVIVVRRGDLERPDRVFRAIGQFVTPVRPPLRGAKAA